MTEPTINYDEHPIDRIYVEWANSLDSAGTDSGPARTRMTNIAVACAMRGVFDEVMDAGTKMELLKKFIFYGKTLENDLDFPKYDLIPRESQTAYSTGIQDHNTVRILHAIMGLVGEASELAHIICDHLFHGIPIDMAEVVDESGDSMWYQALLAKASGHLTFDEFLMANRAKLTARYKTGQWSQSEALNPDKATEMLEMEKLQPMPKTPEPMTRRDDAVKKFPTLSSIVSQLSACQYQSRDGNHQLENNLAFEALRWYAYREFMQDWAAKRDALSAQEWDGDIEGATPCPSCGHQRHRKNGCFNAESDNDCDCQTDSLHKTPGGDIDPQQTRLG